MRELAYNTTDAPYVVDDAGHQLDGRSRGEVGAGVIDASGGILVRVEDPPVAKPAAAAKSSGSKED